MTRARARGGLRRRRALLILAAASATTVAACGPPADAVAPPPTAPAVVSSLMALSADDALLWVADPDEDAVSLIDTRTRALVAVIPLAPTPALDPVTRRYDPAVKPRSLALVRAPAGERLYVAGQLASRVYVIDPVARVVLRSIPVGAAPTALVAAPDGAAVYVVSHEAGTLSRIDTADDTVSAILDVGEHPFGASLAPGGGRLRVTRFLLDPGVTDVDTASYTIVGRVTLADVARAGRDKRLPNGAPRGVYAAVPRPPDGELWLPHLLLSVETAQPELDFESTVFPTVARLDPATLAARAALQFRPLGVAGAGTGGFTDSVSGPRAIAFTPDGALALLLCSASEDVLVFDGRSGNQLALVRPLRSAFPEDLVIDHAGARAYVLGRNSGDVTVLRIDRSDTITPVTVDGAPIPRLTRDPMPADLRLGQRLFYSANSAWAPITRNFWVACSSCHLEGGTDAVTWLFSSGPRDTPTNAGGTLGTGFLLRQAQRNDVSQYDTTINIEQGGRFDRNDPAQRPLLDAVADFVNRAIPLPPNPHVGADGALSESQRRGAALFAARCASCHAGDKYTDSGKDNPTLDPLGTIVLHDVGTCVKTGPHPDQPGVDELIGLPRGACDFDTPTLRGVFATAPYLHDGSAATLRDATVRMPGAEGLDAAQLDDLVAFVRSL